MYKSVISLFFICGLFALTGCYQKAGVSLHEPGKYEGRSDPLLAKLKTTDWQHKLDERFKLSQTDR